LTAIETLEGRPTEALAVSARGVQEMRGTVGASVYAYRAEANHALGRMDEALADLERSVALSPTRFGAWVELALVLASRGEQGRVTEIFARLVTDAPGLIADAARAEGLVLWKSEAPKPTDEERMRILRRTLTLLGGNRSSTCVTYRTAGGRLRYVPRPGGRRPHETDADDLVGIRALLMRAMGLTRAARSEP
jgi:tetratricopeptide (TPR) repeat protein